VSRALRAEGHAVEIAADGAQALQRLKVQTPDILITDIIMPNGDGIELITAVKKAYPAVRILAMSGRGTLGKLDLLDLAAMLGADAILAKPLAPEELLAKVAELRSAP
jgi:DNA-binding response OmpR family regulator